MDSRRFVISAHRKAVKRAARRCAKTKWNSRSHTKAMKRLLRIELHYRIAYDIACRRLISELGKN